MKAIPSSAGWRIEIHKYRATWYWTTYNPSGGSFGSNLCGPKHVALARAAHNIPEGAEYTVNGVRMVRRTIGGAS